jgi:ABC-type transport system involved in cytochrome c biogenesis permease subunit
VDARAPLLVAGAGLLALGAVLAVPAAAVTVRPLWRRASRWAGIAGMFASAGAAALEWAGLGRPPVCGLSEPMLLLAPALALGYLIIEGLSKSREGGLPVLLAAAGAALGGLAAARAGAAADPLPPGMDGLWLVPYALATGLAYGLLGVAGIQALTFLLVERIWPNRAERAGRGAYWAACLGFPLLAGSLMLGACWAQSARGDYWTWTARESWTLVYALVLLAFLNLRYVGHWPERRSAAVLALSLGLWLAAFAHAWELPAAGGDAGRQPMATASAPGAQPAPKPPG